MALSSACMSWRGTALCLHSYRTEETTPLAQDDRHIRHTHSVQPDCPILGHFACSAFEFPGLSPSATHTRHARGDQQSIKHVPDQRRAPGCLSPSPWPCVQTSLNTGGVVMAKMACGGAVLSARPLLFLLLLLCELAWCELVETTSRGGRSRGYASERDSAGMKAGRFGAAMLPLAANAVNVVVSNDDGWVSRRLLEMSSCGHMDTDGSCEDGVGGQDSV